MSGEAVLPEDELGETAGQAASHDAYLACIEYFCGQHELPFSAASALRGVPLENGALNASTFEQACLNLGLKTKRLARLPSQIPSIVCPFMVFFKNGDVGVVTEKKTRLGRMQVFLPGLTSPKKLSRKALDKQCHEVVFYVSKAEEPSKSHFEKIRKKSGAWLWPTVWRFWPSWTQVIVAALFINLLGLALPLFVMNVYDRVIPYNAFETLWALTLGVGLAVGFDFLLRMTRALVIDSSAQRIDMHVSSNIFEHALDIKMSQRPRRAGDIASQIREFESVRDFFASASITSAIDLLFIGVFLFLLWMIVGPLALVPLAAVPLVLLVTMLIQIPLARAVAAVQASSENRHSVLIESLVGIETIKAIAAEGAFQHKWEAAAASSVRANASTRFWSSFSTYFSMTVQQAVSIVIVVWGVYLIAEGQISVGALIASNILAGRVLAPLGGIAMTLTRLQQSIQSLRGLNILMKLEGDRQSKEKRPGEIVSGQLDVRNLSFSYPEQTIAAIDDVSFAAASGEKIGIIGKVGSGKSTFGKVLAGLYDASAGSVLLDGVDVQNRSSADVRKAVCYVGQDPDLFLGSIRENILLGRVVDAQTFERAVKISGVEEFAQGQPLGLELQVGERGQLISGGQRQAVVLARALVGNPKILFLDEPTAAMDNRTEAAFVQNFGQWRDSEMTLIISTHRTSLLRLVDRLVFFDKGKIIEQGDRDAVLAKLQPQTATNASPVKKSPPAKKSSAAKQSKASAAKPRKPRKKTDAQK